jgi:hypothetical protein
LLLESGANDAVIVAVWDVFAPGSTALHVAAANEKMATMQLLVDAGANLKIKDKVKERFFCLSQVSNVFL